MDAVLKRVESLVGLEMTRMGPLAISFAVAEALFKFGSFTLECAAFLVLWRLLDWVYGRALDTFRKR